MATQVLATSPSHFAQYPASYDTSMFATLPAYGGVSTGEVYQGYQPEQPSEHAYMISPRTSVTEDTIRRPPSLSPNAQMRLPPRRDRTPIRHHRPSVSRPRSHSRSEMIMAYATDQAQAQAPATAQPSVTVVPSQSAPTTPQIFPGPPGFALPPAGEQFSDPSSYFPTTMSLPDYSYTAPHYQSFYQLGRPQETSELSLNPQETVYLPQQPQQASFGLPGIGDSTAAFPPISRPLESTHGELEILSSRPKPQCWEHGCNGRQFSTFSNLLRHQREKSGSAMKALCPYCGTEFTRTTARNGHMYGGKCRGKPDKEPSEGSTAGSVSGKEK